MFKLLGPVQPELGFESLPAAYTDVPSFLQQGDFQFGEVPLPGPVGQGRTLGSDTGVPP